VSVYDVTGPPAASAGAPDLRALGGRDEVDGELTRMDLNTGSSEASGLRERLAEELGDLALEQYGDERALPLRRTLAALSGRAADEIFVANGSMAVLEAILASYGGRGRRALAFVPSYAGLQRLCHAMDTELALVARGPRFEIEPGAAQHALAEKRPRLVFFCHPNNPTGRPEDAAVVSLACRLTPQALVVVDEAYVEFCEERSMQELADRPENLVVVRSLSKAWGLAGARVGYALAGAPIVATLFAGQLPGAVSAVTQAVARAALREDPVEQARRISGVRAERTRLARILRAIPGVQVWPSSANFLLFRSPGPVGQLLESCARERVLVRDVGDQPGLEGCLRATIATVEASDRLGRAVAAVAGGEQV
jgi:histidinol-phosphate aminotransferase